MPGREEMSPAGAGAARNIKSAIWTKTRRRAGMAALPHAAPNEVRYELRSARCLLADIGFESHVVSDPGRKDWFQTMEGRLLWLRADPGKGIFFLEA